jgi:hypothetical protein
MRKRKDSATFEAETARIMEVHGIDLERPVNEISAQLRALKSLADAQHLLAAEEERPKGLAPRKRIREILTSRVCSLAKEREHELSRQQQIQQKKDARQQTSEAMVWCQQNNKGADAA